MRWDPSTSYLVERVEGEIPWGEAGAKKLFDEAKDVAKSKEVVKVVEEEPADPGYGAGTWDVPAPVGRLSEVKATRGVRRIFERGKRGVGAKRRLQSPRKMLRTASCCGDQGAQPPDFFAELRAKPR